MSTASTPDFHDAELVLRLYEMRREAVMRKSRDTISFTFWPKTIDDVAAIMDFSHPDNAAWRQIASYWEMVFGFAKEGIANSEFLVENNGEGLLLFVKVRPFVAELRATAPHAFQNCEWAATQTEAGRQRMKYFEERFADKVVLPATAS
jgi:hypothetical protein